MPYLQKIYIAMANDKSNLHPRNKHRERYNFQQLIESYPVLAQFVGVNKYGDESIDFFDAKAVKILNKTLLIQYYDIEGWDIPMNYLTPPIPGRADYIHYIADLLGNCNNGKIPIGNKILCLDTGVGASCIYPIIGNKEYGWSFLGSDIDSTSIKSVSKILKLNPTLQESVELRQQHDSNNIFKGIIGSEDIIDITICNPPFHASLAEAESANMRKLRNLKHKQIKKASLNFGGQSNELWCKGGEGSFVRNMILESKQITNPVMWFSTLISKESNLTYVYKVLEKNNAADVRTINMGQGNKKSRIVAWTFLSKEKINKWVKARW